MAPAGASAYHLGMNEDAKIAETKAELAVAQARRAVWSNGLGSRDTTEFHRLDDRIKELEQMLADLGSANA
jgi:hypothetical protein